MTMIALCIGLELPNKVSLAFKDKEEFYLKSNTHENILYKFFLKDGCSFDIYQCDEILKTKGFREFVKD